jgi:hypothetical protein
VPLSQGEARVQMVPTLAATLGVKGHRPVVGTRDCKDVLYVFGVLNLIFRGFAHQHPGELAGGQPQEPRQQDAQDAAGVRGPPATRRQGVPQEGFERVVLTIDNAPWHRGPLLNEALTENPHLEFYRLPSYSPSLNVIERFWKRLRRRATHDRLFDAVADSKGSIRASLSYFQTVRAKALTLINGRPKKSSK